MQFCCYSTLHFIEGRSNAVFLPPPCKFWYLRDTGVCCVQADSNCKHGQGQGQRDAHTHIVNAQHAITALP